MAESWKDIPGWEGRYQISDHGRVKSIRTLVNGTATERMLQQRPGKKGHLRVALCREGVCTDYRVHCLVLEAFVGPRPEGHVGCHWDDNPENNHLGNLRWGSDSDNLNDRVRNGKHHNANQTHCKHGHEFSGKNLAIRPDGARACRACRHGRSRKHRYGDDPIQTAHKYYKEVIG